jgi:hypothetical protein
MQSDQFGEGGGSAFLGADEGYPDLWQFRFDFHVCLTFTSS